MNRPFIYAFLVFAAIGLAAGACAPQHQAGDDDDDDDNDDDDSSPGDDSDDDDDDNDNDDDDFVWSPMSGTFPALSGVSGTSHSDVYAAGIDHASDHAAILHFDGLSWSAVGNMPSHNGFGAVWCGSSSDVFAAGGNGLVMHFDGASWSTMVNETGMDSYGVWGTSATDVFTAGWTQLGPMLVGAVSRYNGNVWLPIYVGPQSLYAVWGTSPTDVFFGGSGKIFRFNGFLWSAMDIPATIGVGAIWGTAPENVFAVGGSSDNLPEILQFDGSSWSVAPPPFHAGNLRGVWGASASDIFAVGGDDIDTGAILHFDGSAWSVISYGSYPFLYSVWGSSAADVFAVGYDHTCAGVILHYGPPQ